MKPELHGYRDEAKRELLNILAYWQTYAVDYQKGGFYGKINARNQVDAGAPKGSVLNSRILWSFSAAFNYFRNEDYLSVATRAFNYINSHFIDPLYGGVYWTVAANGTPQESKKQLYASAFALYGVAEYYKATGDPHVKDVADNLYNAIIQYGHDPKHGGFFEAFSRDWKELPDQRLSNKDVNAKKSMNTNLHVLEAFANLYSVWPDAGLKEQITELLRIFSDKIVDATSGHLNLFFDEEWKIKPAVISFGHDIEASWLLLESATIINDKDLILKLQSESIQLADAAMRGLDADGGLWYEFDPGQKKMVREKHWWPQAEAMVGFFNAWQITDEQRYLDASLNSWKFIQSKIIDKDHGEWHWGIEEDGSIMPAQDKIGIWKCPYHNSRACLEVIKKIKD